VKACVLANNLAYYERNIALAYTCHVINKEYLIGYGRDHRSHFQNLPDIYRLNPERILKKYKTMPLSMNDLRWQIGLFYNGIIIA